MTRNRTARTNIGALIIGVVFAACSAKPMPQHATAVPSHDAGLPNGRGGEIATLDDQIAHDMAQIGADVPTQDEVISAEVSHSVPPLPMSSGAEPDIASTCPSPPSGGDSCSDVCTLADSICANADRICAIAADLGDDTHATQRCDAGKLSCDRAKARCCDCD